MEKYESYTVTSVNSSHNSQQTASENYDASESPHYSQPALLQLVLRQIDII